MERSRRVLFPLGIVLVVFMAMIDVSSAEPNYVIKFIKMENYMDETAPIEVLDGEMVRYNKSIIVSNITVDVKEVLAETVVCLINGFEKATNGKYVSSNLNLGPVSCKDLTDNDLYRSMLPVSNLPATFPVQKGIYSVINYLLRSESLPDTIPGSDHWKFEIKVTLGDKILYHVGIYLQFDKSAWQKEQSGGGGAPGR